METINDKQLMARCGKEHPFKVPKGYFEQLHDQLMNHLPEPETLTTAPEAPVSLMTRIKPWFYMAAMFAGIIFMVQGLMYVQENRLTANEKALTDYLYADEADDFMSSSLYNEDALYSYLTTSDNN